MAKRLPEGIRLLPTGRYQARYSVNGVQKSAGTFAKLQDAKDARSLALAERRQGVWVDPRGPRMTFEAWTTEWQKLRNRNDTRTRSFLKVHILPAFGQQRLGQITPPDVQHWVRELERRDVAATTVRAIYALFKSIMDTAVDMDVLAKSPCRSTVHLPRASKPKRTALTVGQVHALEQAAKVGAWSRYGHTNFAAMIHLAAWTGMRWQELAALRWENINLSTGVIVVSEAVKAESKTIGTTKNSKPRTVHLGPTTLAVLRGHRRDYGGRGLLFPNRVGRHQDYGSFRKQVWYEILDAAGVERCGFHSLRHHFASRMVEQGVDPKVLSETMGHHAPSFTLDRYGSAREDGAAVLVAAAEEAMKPR